MSKPELTTLFITALTKVVSNKKELVYKIVDILDLEPESVYRRLAGTVKFSTNEIGILAKEMNISIDSLLNQDPNKIPVFVEMNIDSLSFQIEDLIKKMENWVLYWEKYKSHNIAIGTISAVLPLELFMYHPHISKYMYFKWGHNFIATRQFDKYSDWEVPKRLTDIHNTLKEQFKEYTNVRFFWDSCLMPNLVKQINYHLFIGILSQEDVQLIKDDLHELLENLENYMKQKDISPDPNEENIYECYITNLNIGMTGYYVICDDSCMSAIGTTYLHSTIHYDHETAIKIYKWINSIKKVSTLISSGEKERIRFFRQQHEIVNSIGTFTSNYF